MTLKINISTELEARLKREASEKGVDEEEYARQLIEKNLATMPPIRDQATLDLFAKWKKEGKASTPEELALAEKEWEEFKKAMNENSMSGRPIYP
jgi:hypothetical protein